MVGHVLDVYLDTCLDTFEGDSFHRHNNPLAICLDCLSALAQPFIPLALLPELVTGLRVLLHPTLFRNKRITAAVACQVAIKKPRKIERLDHIDAFARLAPDIAPARDAEVGSPVQPPP